MTFRSPQRFFHLHYYCLLSLWPFYLGLALSVSVNGFLIYSSCVILMACSSFSHRPIEVHSFLPSTAEQLLQNRHCPSSRNLEINKQSLRSHYIVMYAEETNNNNNKQENS